MDLYLFEFMFGLLPQVILLCTPFYFYYLYQVRLRVEYLEKLTTGKQLNFDKYDGIYLPKLLAYENYLYFVLYFHNISNTTKDLLYSSGRTELYELYKKSEKHINEIITHSPYVCQYIYLITEKAISYLKKLKNLDCDDNSSDDNSSDDNSSDDSSSDDESENESPNVKNDSNVAKKIKKVEMIENMDLPNLEDDKCVKSCALKQQTEPLQQTTQTEPLQQTTQTEPLQQEQNECCECCPSNKQYTSRAENNNYESTYVDPSNIDYDYDNEIMWNKNKHYEYHSLIVEKNITHVLNIFSAYFNK